MTREEAIERLKNTAWLGSNNDRESTEEAVRMAIEALSAEQVTGKLNKRDDSLLTDDTETCKEQKSKLDLISRQDAINAVEVRIKWFNGDAIEDRCKRDAFIQVIDEILTELPSADRPTGEWVRKYDKHINCYWYECNQCGEDRPRNVFGNEWSSPYCPNCGAKMGGDTE